MTNSSPLSSFRPCDLKEFDTTPGTKFVIVGFNETYMSMSAYCRVELPGAVVNTPMRGVPRSVSCETRKVALVNAVVFVIA